MEPLSSVCTDTAPVAAGCSHAAVAGVAFSPDLPGAPGSQGARQRSGAHPGAANRAESESGAARLRSGVATHCPAPFGACSGRSRMRSVDCGVCAPVPWVHQFGGARPEGRQRLFIFGQQDHARTIGAGAWLRSGAHRRGHDRGGDLGGAFVRSMGGGLVPSGAQCAGGGGGTREPVDRFGSSGRALAGRRTQQCPGGGV